MVRNLPKFLDSSALNVGAAVVFAALGLLGCGAVPSPSAVAPTQVSLTAPATAATAASFDALNDACDRLRLQEDLYASFAEIHGDARFRAAAEDLDDLAAACERVAAARLADASVEGEDNRAAPAPVRRRGVFARADLAAEYSRLLIVGQGSRALAYRLAMRLETSTREALLQARHATDDLPVQRLCARLERECGVRRYTLAAGLRLLGEPGVAEYDSVGPR